MNRMKFKGFLQEFPALKELPLRRIQEEDLEDFEIKIKRLDWTWLNTPPACTYWDGSCVGISADHQIFAVLKNGDIVDLKVKNKGESGSNYAHSETRYYEGETPLEAIDRAVNAEDVQLEDVQFLIDYERGLYTHEHYSYGACLWILKPERAVTLEARIKDARKAALAQVRAEAEF